MNIEQLYQRSRNLLLTPEKEWRIISTEQQSVSFITINFILPHTIVLVLCILLGSILFRDISFGWLLGRIICMGGCIPAGIFLGAYTINKIAPQFHTQTNYTQVFTTLSYSSGAVLLIWSVSELIPYVGLIKILGLYSMVLYQHAVTLTLKVDSEHRPLYWASGCVIGLVGVWFCFLVMKNVTSFLF